MIKPGRVLFEMGGVRPDSQRAFQLAAYKLPMKTRTLGKSGVKAATDVKIKGTGGS